MAHARIDPGVDDVDRQVHTDEREAQEQHGALHERVVARQDRLHDQAPNARQCEHLLDDHGAADGEAEDDAGDGDDGDQRVAESVAGDGAPLRHTLGARGANKILVEHIQRRRSRHAGEEADLKQRQHR